MEPKTFIALTDEQLVILSWAMETYREALGNVSINDATYMRIYKLREKMRKHAASAWTRMTTEQK